MIKTFRMLQVAMSLAVVIVLAALTLAACDSAEESGGVNSPSIPDGQRLFVANCAACHGESGQGAPRWRVRNDDGSLPPPPLNGDGHTWHHSDGVLYRVVKGGGDALGIPNFKSGMPAFVDRLSHEEIIAVLTYVKSLWVGKGDGDMTILDYQSRASQNDPFPPKAKAEP